MRPQERIINGSEVTQLTRGKSHDSNNIVDVACPDFIHTIHIHTQGWEGYF